MEKMVQIIMRAGGGYAGHEHQIYPSGWSTPVCFGEIATNYYNKSTF